MSSLELSSEFELRQKTCWSFKSKVQQAMESSLNHPLTGTIHVDEFMVGGPEENKKGRSKGLKKLAVLALEILDDGVGRAYAEVIEHSWATEFGAQKTLKKFENQIFKGFLKWYLQGSNQGHMDFQSIALPSELRYLACSGCKYRTIFNLSKTNFKKNQFVPSPFKI